MSAAVDKSYLNLREKLNILGYRQTLPPSAVPLVGALFEDLVRTTESLRDAKLEIGKYLEEKTCWELGIEPYKCDNSRLLSECNSLHQELIRQKDVFEEKICDYRQTIRNLEADNRHLEEHSTELEKNVRALLLKTSGTSKNSKNDVNMSRKPFVSAVKSGSFVPSTAPMETSNAYRCTKCSSTMWTNYMDGKNQEEQLLQNGIQAQTDQISCLKEKLERREREITRLNNLLSGGRPAVALARECCFKDVGTLSEDVETLQKEKIELLKKYREAQDSMHEAMQRAIALEEKNKQCEKDLKDFEIIALNMEKEANLDLLKKEKEILALRKELEKLKNLVLDKADGKYLEEKRKLHEQLNSLTQTEKELSDELEKMQKKNQKLKAKIAKMEKDITKGDESQLTSNENMLRRYKTERDFFQEEYLKMVEQSVSNKEVQMLKIQLEAKDQELESLMKEVIKNRCQSSHTLDENRPVSSHSVQAAIMRAERERDVIKDELKLIRMERDCLREKLERSSEIQTNEKCRIEEENRILRNKIDKLKSEKRDIITSHIPERTQLTLLKEEMEEIKKRIQSLLCENHQLSTKNGQLRILQDQTEKALIDHQNKLLAAETNLENAEYQLGAISTNRETTRYEVSTLQKEVMALKSRNSALEQEKDKIMCDLDTKTEKIYQLEQETKCALKQKQELQCKVKELDRRLSDTANQKQEFESELHESSTESKTLRDQLCSLKIARDHALVENIRITNELAEVSANMIKIEQKLKESEKEVELLKQQLQQYVQEVQRAEELLLLKEQEREEMLEHYRSLSHDAVLLEGNNQSLEIEAAEQKQQLCDVQLELTNLKKELTAKDDCISKLEAQVSLLSSQICDLQTELDQTCDELKLTKIDAEASKELISKLDVKRGKLNAELEESKTIRCQLETEIEALQREMREDNSKDQVQMISLEDLLKCTRKELEFQRKKTYEQNQDIALLKQTITELEAKLCLERKKAEQNELLIKEYSVKIRELEQQLTDIRFQLGRSKEDSPRYPTL